MESQYTPDEDGYLFAQVWGSTSTINLWINDKTLCVPLSYNGMKAFCLFVKAGIPVWAILTGENASALFYPIKL